MEFLMGRSLKNNLYNLDLTETFKKALESFDVSLDKLYEKEPDAGLGNGGLGRLAACYLDGLATNGFQSMGYSIRYEAGIFKQKLVDGWQTELPDFWLPGGEVWLVPREERSVGQSACNASSCLYTSLLEYGVPCAAALAAAEAA